VHAADDLGVADYPWVWELFIPYKDFAGRQLTVAVVRLVQDDTKADWRLWDARQSTPEDVTFPIEQCSR
jgi:hypothetical protein